MFNVYHEMTDKLKLRESVDAIAVRLRSIVIGVDGRETEKSVGTEATNFERNEIS